MRFYVKERPGDAIQGPYPMAQLREMLEAGTLSRSALAVEARGQNLFQLRATNEWRDIGSLLPAVPEGEITQNGTANTPETADPLLAGKNLPRTLIISGMLLVVSSRILSVAIIPKFWTGEVLAWDAATSDDLTLVIRILGVMVFVTGLVERLISASRDFFAVKD